MVARRSASLHCGLLLSARPAGQHLTQRRALGQLVHHVGRGSERDETVMASSSSFGGDARCFQPDEALENKGQRQDGAGNEGQMGQPAACMMDSNSLPLRCKVSRQLWPTWLAL